MSLIVMRQIYYSRLPRPLRLLALTLAWFADDDGGRIFPSVERLAEMTGVSERQVQRELGALRRLGVLAIESRVVVGADGQERPAGGVMRTTRYRLQLSQLDRIGLKKGDTGVTLQASNIHSFSTKGDVDVTVSEAERVTSEVVNGDIQGQKGDIQGTETVTSTSPDPSVICQFDPSVPASADRASREDKPTAGAVGPRRVSTENEEDEEDHRNRVPAMPLVKSTRPAHSDANVLQSIDVAALRRQVLAGKGR